MNWIRFDEQLPEEGQWCYVTVENSDGKREVLGKAYQVYFTNNLRDHLSQGLIKYDIDYVHTRDQRYIKLTWLDDEKPIDDYFLECIPNTFGFYEIWESDCGYEVKVIQDKVIAWMEVGYPDPYEG